MSNLMSFINMLNRVNNVNIFDTSFQDQGNRTKPCSASFVDSLEEYVVTNEDIDNNLSCAVCQDEFKIGEKTIKLPCKDPHYFHFESPEEQCGGILPWLKEHNSCPICREEFPEEGQDNIPVPDENFDEATDNRSTYLPEGTEQIIEYIVSRMNIPRNTELPPHHFEVRPRPTGVSFQFIQVPIGQIPYNFINNTYMEQAYDPDLQEAIRQSLL